MEILLFKAIRAMRTLWTDPQFKSLTRLVLIAITSGTVVYWLVEDLRPVDALYFSVTTLTTVGYGDFSPKTDAGKLFTVFYVLVGVGLLLAFLGRVAGQVVTIDARDREAKNGKRHAWRVAERARRRRDA